MRPRKQPQAVRYREGTYVIAQQPTDISDILDVEDSSRQEKPRLIGDRLIRGRERLFEPFIIVPAATGLITYRLPDAVKDLREAAYLAMHAAKTGKDALIGGPEGQRGAKSLEEAIRMVSQAGATNDEARKALEQLYASRKAFAESLANVYAGNETTGRAAQRMTVQLKGAAKNFFEVGNDLKPDAFKQTVDYTIIISYGKLLRQFGHPTYKSLTDEQIIVKALENSENLKQFYTEVRKFYDSREKGEQAINAFTNYIETTVQKAEADNKQIEQLYPKLIQMLKEGYTVEDWILATDRKGVDMTKKDVRETGEKVTGHESQVTGARTEVQQYTPLPGQSPDWIGIATNPLAIALSAYVVYRGIRAAALPRFADTAISRATVYPVKAALNGAHTIYQKATAFPRPGGQA
ncbi:hypothetical protein HY640_04800 [Candidatus Woesearchaeota archaeon]|nr:hypothetical protein [Candidatus Woesearchaeota archaeon]